MNAPTMASGRPGYSRSPSLALAYVALAVYLGSMAVGPDAAIGPIASWLIPALLAYIPGLLIGFLAFTADPARYRPTVELRRQALAGRARGPR